MQGQDKLLVGCIYRSPSAAMVISISSLCSLLEELNDFTHLLICGDFNMKNINWSNMSVNPGNTHVESFIDTIQDLFLFQHMQEPTRYRPGTTPSLLDLVFTNEANMINHIDYLLAWEIAIMFAFIFICLVILPSNQTTPLDTM